MDQGFGDAASTLGMDYQAERQFTEAVKAFQNGGCAGDPQSARFLANGFNSNPSDKLYYLGVQNDPERSRRYKLIGKFIADHEGLNPKVPDIDQIVPLPPAKLPDWDSTFQWQKEQDVWCAKEWIAFNPKATRRIGKGETMPALTISNPRSVPGLDALLGMRTHRTPVTWSLVSHDGQA